MNKVQLAITTILALSTFGHALCVDFRNTTPSNATGAYGKVATISVGGTRNIGLVGTFYFQLKDVNGEFVQVRNTAGECITGEFYVETNDISRDLLFRQIQETKSNGGIVTVLGIDNPGWRGFGSTLVYLIRQD